MPIVTFTSDYGWNDPDTAVVRGLLYSEMARLNCNGTVVDISHGIALRNHQEAAYVISSTYSSFPKGSIHLVLIDSFDLGQHMPMLVEFDGHYFLGLNNGSLAFIPPGTVPNQVIQIDLRNRLDEGGVEAKLAAAVAHLANGGLASLLGPPLREFNRLHFPHPEIKNSHTAIVHVQFIDHFGQIITNASETWLSSWHAGHSFVALVRGRRVTTLLENAGQLKDPSLLYYRMNRYGFLEIGISQPGANGQNAAARLLGVSVQDPIELQRAL